MIRAILVLLMLGLVISCGTTPKIDYSNRLDSNDFDSAGEAIRLSKLRVDQTTPNRVTEFVFDEDGQIVFVCDYGNCERFKQESGFSIYLNYDGSYSSFSRVISPRAIQICGTGDAYAIFDSLGWWRKLGLQRNRSYIGRKDYSKKDPEFCYHTFSKVADNWKYMEVSISDAISTRLAHAHVHIRESDPDALKLAVVQSDLDIFTKQMFLNDSYKITNDYKVIEYKANTLRKALQEHLSMPISKSGNVDGILFFNNDINPIATPLTFYAKANSDQLPSLLDMLYQSLGNQQTTSKKKSEVLAGFIPPKVPKPEIPAIPKLEKGEFEKQSTFELRAKKLVIKKEQEIHKRVQDYNFEVFSRNEYVKALYRSYNKYLNKQSLVASKNQQTFIENQDLVSLVVLKTLYSDLIVNEMNYDSETEQLYMSLASPRNNFNEKIVVELVPEIAKKVKLNNDYQLSLDLSVNNNNLSFSGINVLHDDEMYKAKFTKSQFKPMRIVMKPTTQIKIEAKDQTYDFSDFLQKDTELYTDVKHRQFYLSLSKDYNLELPSWFINPCQDCVTSKGQSLNEALSNARAELSRRKRVKVAANQNVNTVMFESGAGASNTSLSFSEIVNIKSDTELTREEYTVTKQKEVDGSWYVELKFL